MVVDIAVGWAVALMPPGVFSLVAGRVAGACDPIETLAALGKFVFAVLLGLALHLFAVAPGLYALATRRRSGGAAKTRSPVMGLSPPLASVAAMTDMPREVHRMEQIWK